MATIGTGTRGILAQAKRAAQRRAQRASTGHVLLVMLQSGSDAGEILAGRGVRETDLLTAIKVVDEEPSSALEVALERAQKVAVALGEREVGPLHLLLSIVRESRSVGHRCLEAIGTGAARIRDDAMGRLGVVNDTSSSPRAEALRPARVAEAVRARLAEEMRTEVGAMGPRPTRTPPSPPPARRRPPAQSLPERPNARTAERQPAAAVESPPKATPSREPASATVSDLVLSPEQYPLLSGIGRNLSAAAEDRALDPVIGRDREIEQLLDVLARRRSNNPVLVGPPGVGKTSVVEGLVQRLLEGGDGVRGLERKIVVELSAGALVAGTGVRGALAKRLSQLREEVRRSEGRIILFIDEIHAIVGGATEGPDDLANEMKAALARGELPCIGATTEAEYRRHFERDPALARRFSPIHVDAPSASAALAILRGIAPRYEVHHAVAFSDEALAAAVDLSVRYVPEQHLPDKAIGIVDLAAARVRRRGGLTVDVAAVAQVVSELARVPLDRLLMNDRERLLSLEERLGERIVGHREPLARIADALRKGAAGFRGRKPLGTFLLLGPTGVGKTETAKAVADVLFAGAMTRIDMSEFSEAHAIARLLGAPPGYVGHDDGGQLTEAVRRRPYQLLLLDEVEKAHPEVLLSLLPMLDEGRLTDARGRTVDFTNVVVFLTSNLGAAVTIPRAPRIGFGDAAEDVAIDLSAAALSTARRALPPELWNRIDEPLFFGPLAREEISEIARRLLSALGARLRSEHGIDLQISPSAVESLLAAGGFDSALGSRPMKRVIGRLVEAPLAARLLSGDLPRGTIVRLQGEGGRVVLLPEGAADAAE